MTWRKNETSRYWIIFQMRIFEIAINSFIQQTCVEFFPYSACNNNQYFTLVNDPPIKTCISVLCNWLYHLQNLSFVLLHSTNDNEMRKKKRFPFENFVIFLCIYIWFKSYKRLCNYHPRGDLINHPCFLFIEILEAINVDKH